MAKILLVEDDRNLLDIYQIRLNAEGHEVVRAYDGQDALNKTLAFGPDLILCDIMMPKLNGFEMLEIMQRQGHLDGVKVIVMSALGEQEHQERANKVGVDQYLVKSQITLDGVIAIVKRALAPAKATAWR